MRLLSIFFFFTGMSLHCVTAGAQWVVTDPGNTAQGIINAANTASTVKQTVEQVNRLQTFWTMSRRCPPPSDAHGCSRT